MQKISTFMLVFKSLTFISRSIIHQDFHKFNSDIDKNQNRKLIYHKSQNLESYFIINLKIENFYLTIIYQARR